MIDHGAPPVLEAASWSVEITGEVRRPRRLTLRDLAALPEVTVPATLMCAGNRRREHHAIRTIRDPVMWGAGRSAKVSSRSTGRPASRSGPPTPPAPSSRAAPRGYLYNGWSELTLP